MPSLPTDMLGYDRAITVFSPDGRLLQVEYARETVKKGATVIGIVAKNAVIFIAEKIIPSKLMIPSSTQKIIQIDDHIVGAGSGLLGDARVLIKKAREEARKQQLTFDEPIDVLTLVNNICDFKQLYTQYGGTRPFGVSLLIGGVDSRGPQLFVTEPAGIFFEYKAIAIGEGGSVVNKFLEKNYTEGLSVKDAIKLGVKALKSHSKSVDVNNIELVVIDGKFRKLSVGEISKALKE